MDTNNTTSITNTPKRRGLRREQLMKIVKFKRDPETGRALCLDGRPFGRPKKSDAEKAIDKGRIGTVAPEDRDSKLLSMLAEAEYSGIKGMKAALDTCTDPQKRSAALINLRALQEKLNGGKKQNTSKEIGDIIRDIKGNELSRDKILEIARRGRPSEEVASIVAKADDAQEDTGDNTAKTCTE